MYMIKSRNRAGKQRQSCKTHLPTQSQYLTVDLYTVTQCTVEWYCYIIAQCMCHFKQASANCFNGNRQVKLLVK